MMEEMKAVDTNTKTQLSLAAALFFSPLVQNILNKSTWDLTEKDKDFVRGYIKFWYITLLFWIITITTWVLNYLFTLKFLSVTYTVSIFILIFLLVIGIVSILSDISLVKWGDYQIKTYTVEGNKKDIIFKYLPLYNIYLRYKIHGFDKPNRRIKESLLLWTIFFLVSLFGNIFLSSTILIIIIFRVAALMSDIDFLNMNVKQQLNILFFKNPEEIVWYVTGFFMYLIKSITHTIFKMQPYSLGTEIRSEKEAYSHIMIISGNTPIIIEYILWILLAIGLIYFIHPNFGIRTYYASIWLFISRYVIMAIQLQHLPHLPIARELLLLVYAIIPYFTRKSFIKNP